MKKALLLLTCLVSPTVAADSVVTGRYTSLAELPEQHQLDPFSDKVSVRFPNSISSIERALQAIVAPTGYNVTEYIPDAVKGVLSRRLPMSQRSFNHLSRRSIIQTLLPDSVVMVTDPHNRLIGFDIHPNYSQYANLPKSEDFGQVYEDSTSTLKLSPDELSPDANTQNLNGEIAADSRLSKDQTCYLDEDGYYHNCDEYAQSKTGMVEPDYVPIVNVGSFRENLHRLAEEFSFGPVIWDARVKDCLWDQVTSYEIPHSEPRDVIGFYASTLDFKAVFSDFDSSVQLFYVGPQKRIKHCEK